jgi:hypothetical protein
MGEKLTTRFGWLAACLVALAGPATAANLVALVEDASGAAVPVGVMDYLSEGQSFALAPDATLTIGYFQSCLRETVTGGRIRIGAAQSAVEGGAVTRDKVECDGGRMLLSAEQTTKSGVVAFRSIEATIRLKQPQVTIFGTSPVFETSGGTAPILIQRLDRAEAERRFTPAPLDLIRGRFFDLATVGGALEPGGIYRAVRGKREIVFLVDAHAAAGRGNLIGRLLKL